MVYSATARAQEHTHSFLACGQTYIMEAVGKASWTYPAASREGYVLDDDTIILTLNKSKHYQGGAAVKITPNKTETIFKEGTKN